MTDEHLDDEILMAYADGELDAETRDRVARAAAGDPDVAARIEDFRRSRMAARALFDALVPGLPAEPAGLVRFRPRARTGAPGRLWPMALAAGLAALAALPTGYLLAPRDGEAPSALVVAAEAPPDLAAILGRLAAGEAATLPDHGTVRPIASFLDGAERLCREFELDSPGLVLAVACTDGAGWQVGLAVALPAEDAYAPAAGVDAVEAYLHAIDAGPPLDPEEEERRLAGSRLRNEPG